MSSVQEINILVTFKRPRIQKEPHHLIRNWNDLIIQISTLAVNLFGYRFEVSMIPAAFGQINVPNSSIILDVGSSTSAV